ncbi:MAG: heavy metal translocating P-type ATPase [Candidatus Heimdallarchaeaceae archaeon]
METKKINIEGMTCASCVARVEKALTSLEGVDSASVNLVAHNAQLIYDPHKVNEKDIYKAVEKAGYKASVSDIELSYMKNKQLVDMRRRFIASLVLTIPVFIFAMGYMAPFNNWFPQFATFLSTYTIFPKMTLSSFIQLALTTPVQFIISWPFYVAAWKSVKNKSASMDVLIVLGTSAAYFYSLFSMIYPYFVPSYHGAIFFETSAILLTFIFLGKYLEEVTKGRTSEAIKKLIELRPKTATIIKEGQEIQIPVDDVKMSDVCVVRPGESIPVDGKVIEGSSYVNESMITGESVSVFKEKDSEVIGGTINENGLLKFQATRVGENTTLSKIIQLVEDAQTSKLPIQKIADKISSIFVPAVVLLSLVTFTIWFLLFSFGVIDSTLLPAGTSIFLFSFLVGIAVLVISCPCALGLATPTAIMVGTGLGAQNGILIRTGEALEKAKNIDLVLLDKTGTITKGEPEVKDIIPVSSKVTKKDIIQIAASLEKGSEHSIAKSILYKAEEMKVDLKDLKAFEALPGKGVIGKIGGVDYYFGNMKLLVKKNLSLTNEVSKILINLEEQGKTVMTLATEKEIVGLIAISDSVKQHSKEAITHLKEIGVRVGMVSGDNKRAAKAIGKEVGIEEIHAEVLPDEKLKIVQEYQNKGLKVAFVGDGINDSPALVQADIGIAVGSGTDIAIEAGDFVLVKNDLRDVVTAIDLSKKTITRVKMGLFWALFYNSIAIPLAAGLLFVLTGKLFPPEIAGLAMALSSVSVVINSLLLKKYKNPFERSKLQKN